MPKFVVNATGHPTQEVGADSWLHALGEALTALGHLDGIDALACEILPNGTVVARNVKTGQGYVVMRSEGEGTPAPAPGRQGGQPAPFEVRNLAQSVFQANLGHALRSPLNAIMGYSGMLLEDAHDLGEPRMAEDLEKIGASARALLALIDAGLEANRVCSEEIRVQRLTFAVRTLLTDAAAAFESEAAARGNRLEVGAADLGEMRTDPTLLRTALLAMLDWSNRRVRDGVIRLHANVASDAQNTEWVTLWVSDDGAPVGDAESAGLFQVMVGTGGGTEGAAAVVRRGIARDLVRRLGGELGLRPRGDGRVALAIRIERGR